MVLDLHEDNRAIISLYSYNGDMEHNKLPCIRPLMVRGISSIDEFRLSSVDVLLYYRDVSWATKRGSLPC